MASSGYYYSPYQYQPAPYYYNYSPHPQQGARGGWQSLSSSVPVFVFLATVSALAATALITLCESAVESLVHQLRGFLILSPVLAVIAVQLWVASGGGGLVSLLADLVTGDQTEQYYQYGYRYGGRGGAGSSPWGVAVALVLVLSLVSYQSSIHWSNWFGR
ncbi:hypothetical protein PR202_ga17820 [Eleusine coracana subsp. coracana]|uniref:Uncharacterized protein n=1 Tax=Eleusine coracana subsp. coracana TaxID=191504 RepID=A0AAV5CQD3_ELECO|nr:hypothetical protein QOZ80_6AG0512950 [Eleusine coracana subsp. coracana]GJN00624.1 hypothetical protein PR202_ga17820 [Eleusine coracana subsp. coracana]